jgi:hypothetical protein
MRQRSRAVLSLLFWILASGVAVAATPPAKIVQQFIEAHLQGRFAEARGFTMEQVALSASLFSGWLFGASGSRGEAGTADIFLSRKFSQTFRYSITGTTPHGDNQVSVTAVRSSPNLAHLYTWALAPKQGATPYALIDAVDAYLTKVNFPVEESRMEFTLIRETGEWYISAIYDEKFAQLQQQWLPVQPVSVALPPPAPTGPLPGTTAATASVTPTPAAGTVTTDNPGRQVADAQFNATMQSFNRPYQPPVVNSPPPAQGSGEEPSFLGKLASLVGLGGKKGEKRAKVEDPSLQQTLANIRDALARYTVGHAGTVPDVGQIYNWQSLRQLVNEYGKKPLPATEAEAGFTFVKYKPDPSREDYVLLVELHNPHDGFNRVEVTPYSVEPVK